MSCQAKGCHLSVRLNQNRAISFHLIPKEDPRRRIWLEAIGVDADTWHWTKNKLVCSKHFKKEDFYFKNGKKFILNTAVPSVICSNNQECSQNQSERNISFLSSTQNADYGPSSSADLENANQAGAETSSSLAMISSSSSSTEPTKIVSIIQSSSSSSMSRDLCTLRIKRKRKLNEDFQNQTGSSSSTSSSTKRRRVVGHLKTYHNYSKSPSHILKHKQELSKSNERYRKQLYRKKQQVATLTKKVFQMKSVIQFLKNQDISNNGVDHIDKTISDVPHLLMSRYLKNLKSGTTTHENYPEPLRKFAATLQFYSSKAYEAVRKEFALALPDQSTIRKWYANVDCDPGFLDTSFEILQKQSEASFKSGRPLVVALMFDEMSLRKQIEYDGKKMCGYVDVGVTVDNDQLDIAGEALVMTVVCHQASWKLPIAYFLIKALSAAEKENIVREALKRLAEKKILVTSVTCDGPNAHFAMFEKLGCNFDASEGEKHLTTCFENEFGQKVFAILDVCHMAKLARNNLASLKVFKNPDGKLVKWDYFIKLQHLQEEETLNLGNKLRRRHIEFSNNKMKVSLAVQTLSRSVADALKYLRVDIKHPDFEGSEATEDFILKINRLFDILNSKSPFAWGDCSALRESTEQTWRPFLEEMVAYLLKCSNIDGRPLYMTNNKTPFKGFAITIKSVIGIFDLYVKQLKILKYLLTFKMSQDHLETFFCGIRARNGWNNNPSPLLFKYAFRRMLLHTRISGQGGNCRVLDDTTVLSVPSSSGKSEEVIDMSLLRRYDLNIDEIRLDDDDFDVTDSFIPLSEISEDIVAYMSGYVLKMLKRRNFCDQCFEGLHSEFIDEQHQNFKLIQRKNRGGLQRPSQGVIKICVEVEKVIRKLMVITDNQIPADTGFQQAFVINISQQFYSTGQNLFYKLEGHFRETHPLQENHSFMLIKNIVAAYVRIRFFNLAKKFSTTAQGKNLRRKLTKLILFSHQ